MPTPQPGESQDDFTSRCIPIVIDDGTAEDNDQAVAVCNSMWEKQQEAAIMPFKDALALLEALQGDLEALGEVTKTVDGKSYPASDFLVVEDAESPSTWHLQVKRNGTPDHNLMGAAWAALHKGYRGNVYEGPDKQKAVTKLKALYAAEDMETPASESDVAEAADMSKLRSLLTQALRMLGPEEAPREESPEEEEAEELGECALVESAGGMLALAEADAVPVDSKRAPLRVEFALIRPGFGNKKDNHYYPAEMLRRDSHVFEGVKMYTTDHREGEKSERTEVAVVEKMPLRFLVDGTPVGVAAVFDPVFAEKTRNRAAMDKLASLECSILAKGRTKKADVDGRKANVVEAITSAQSVDFVTKAGAGGRALQLVESAFTENTYRQLLHEGHAQNLAEAEIELTGGDSVETNEILSEEVEEVMPEQVEEVVEETPETTEPEPEQVEEVWLSEDAVTSILADAKLPEKARARLAEQQYSDEGMLRTAVQSEADYIKELTGAGQPVIVPGKAAPERKAVPLAEREAAQSKINQKWLGTRARKQEG